MSGDPERMEINTQSKPSPLILFVDDNPALRTIIPEVLSRCGNTVTTADGGESCLQMLKEMKPDMILLDIMMEPMDGWDTLKAIRKVPEYQDIPIVVLTGKVFLPSEMLKYGQDIVGWIKKPVRMEPFTTAIQSIITELEGDRRFAEESGGRTSSEERDQIALHRRRLRVLRRIYDGIITQCIHPNSGSHTGWEEDTKMMTDLIAGEEQWCRDHGIL
ncbi:response regulator [Methanocalculus sp.]|uniref:response regulator n=1 Tax=Methanocalculus sp. TaxID=2004547 RepID=UPI00271CE482|nr:response regulator [Methanocalculus sp.]MDO8841104.1 response regulator [Methanocalculus sp.]